MSNETAYAPKKKRSLFWPIFCVIVFLAAVAFFMSRAGFDKAIVKQKLDAYIAAVKEKGRAEGRAIDITYGDLELVGSFARKHVVIHTLSMTVRPLNAAPNVPAESHRTDSLLIATNEVDVYPLGVDLSSARITFPTPITFADANTPNKMLMSASASTPLEFTVERTGGDVPHTKISHTSPAILSVMFLREQQGAGAEEATPAITPVYDTLDIAIAGGGSLATDFANDGSGLGKADIVYKAITMAPKSDPKGVVTIDAIESHWDNTLNAQALNDIHSTITIGPINAAEDLIPYAPVMLAFDANYVGALPKTPQAAATTEAREATFALRKFLISTKDSSLTASGNFTASASDILPVGKADIVLTNVPFILGELRKTGVVNPENEAWVDEMLEHIAGAPIGTLKDLTIMVARARGGSFNIGKSTFEELFALMLKHAVQQKAGIPAPAATPAPIPASPAVPGAAPVPAPALPSADKPKSAPIAVPDAGTRG
jgi:hypothetical protein